jgi:hypothetical protein
MKLNLARAATVLGLSAVSALASAASIPGLVNTGAGLTAGQVDSSYSFTALTGTAVGTGGHGAVTSDNAFPFPNWLDNSADSKWLTPTADQGASYDPSGSGTYSWTLNFDLTGYDASTASFSGRWVADNYGQLYLNGQLISTTSNSLTNWTAIAEVSSGFNAGVNTLQFVVTNYAAAAGNPTGLRAEFSSNVSAVPEPETYALMLAGLAAVGFIARRRKI